MFSAAAHEQHQRADNQSEAGKPDLIPDFETMLV